MINVVKKSGTIQKIYLSVGSVKKNNIMHESYTLTPEFNRIIESDNPKPKTIYTNATSNIKYLEEKTKINNISSYKIENVCHSKLKNLQIYVINSHDSKNTELINIKFYENKNDLLIPDEAIKAIHLYVLLNSTAGLTFMDNSWKIDTFNSKIDIIDHKLYKSIPFKYSSNRYILLNTSNWNQKMKQLIDSNGSTITYYKNKDKIIEASKEYLLTADKNNDIDNDSTDNNDI